MPMPPQYGLAEHNGRLVLVRLPSSEKSNKIIDPSLVLSEALLGGEEGIEPLHWIDLDKDISAIISVSDLAQEKGDEGRECQMGEKLWRRWVWEYEGGIGKLVIDRQVDVLREIKLAQQNPKNLLHHYHSAVNAQDDFIKARLVQFILIIEDSLNTVLRGTKGGSFGGGVKKRLEKKKDEMRKWHGTLGENLKGCVQEGEGWKVKGNAAGKAGKHELALRHYLDGLAALVPWTGSTAMTYEIASKSGLLKLEQALIGNIAAIALSAPAKTGPKRSAWDEIAQLACSILLEMRYASFGTLQKAFDRLAQLDEKKGEMDSTYRLMADLFKGKNSEGWAHENCVREHVCHE
ncbi:hypothetical protein CI109_100887 [Kwoniella shandongensis]|uniref:Uncharacterized protein n=1 Tax=Kwoniella shandongensis TaxID=1734106 RepID=A0A5M6BS12_9TREE|nr:uncharacterized protein CI109_006140 [Kwoniella shandongensis]KAA5525567.1 hypothetical protein CI109_006140 [Kwoniella shandongensis]